MVTPPGSLAFYVLSFRVLIGLHGAALLFIMLMGTGAIESVFVPAFLRLPLFVFLMGLVSASGLVLEPLDPGVAQLQSRTSLGLDPRFLFGLLFGLEFGAFCDRRLGYLGPG